MPEISTQQVEKLASLAAALQAFVESFEAKRVKVPPEIAAVRDRLVAAGTCLRCLQKRGGRYTRGQCANCYNITNKEITSHEASLDDLMRIGRITEPKKSGRKGVGRLPSSQLNDIVQATGGLKALDAEELAPSPLLSPKAQDALEAGAEVTKALKEQGTKKKRQK